MNKLINNIKVRGVITVAAGALLGYAYYYFIGCNGGACPITSNPYISTLYGGLIGLVFAFPSKRKREAADGKENN